MATDVLRIVAIGDSLIYGRRDPIRGGWIGRLRRIVEEHGPSVVGERGPRMSALFNLGISGETSADVLRRASAELLAREPNLVIVGAGTNDLRRSGAADGPPAVPVDAYGSNIEELARLCRGLGARVVVTGPVAVDENRTLPHENGFYYSNRDVRAYGAQAEEVATAYGAYLALTPALAEEEDDTLRLFDPDLLVDGIHPGTAGHARMLDVAAGPLSSLLPLDFPDAE